MKTHVEFRSTKFPPYDGEEDEINPGRFGKRVAAFLANGLTREGFKIDELIAEDWGWVIPIVNPDFRLWIGCGNYDEYSDGDGFLCFIEPHKPVIWKFFRKIQTEERIDALRIAMDKVLSSESGITDVKWWSHDEFNKP
jgi:hypothetical protein